MNTTLATVSPSPKEIERVSTAPVYTFGWATSEAELKEVFKFRYQIYFEEMGRDQKHADVVNKMLRDNLDTWGHQLFVRSIETGQIVAIARLNLSADGDLPEDELYKFSEFTSHGASQVALVTKMMIDRDHRGSRIFRELCIEIYKKVLSYGCDYAFIATADHLVPLFRRIGFRQHQPRTTWADYGSSNPMVFDCRNLSYLKEIKSPLFDTGEHYYAFRRIDQKQTINNIIAGLFKTPIYGISH